MNLKNCFFVSVFVLVSVISCSPSKNIEVSKSSPGEGGPQTLIYSLPKTRIDINIAVTKIITKAGPYAAYAEKYLILPGVPQNDFVAYEISSVKIQPINEPDPEQVFAVNFRTYPASLERLFSATQQGLMLNPENLWNTVLKEFPSKYQGSGVLFDRGIYDPAISEHVDTLYKTILTDASFVKVPIYKKSIKIKTDEEKAEDMANLILKLRKRRVKLMMGEYEYHPDGAALKVIVEELAKQEDDLMSYFVGKKVKETQHYVYSFKPTGSVSKELLWFNEEKGVSDTPVTGTNAISAFFTVNDIAPSVSESKNAEKTLNSIYYRAPVMTQVSLKIGSTLLTEAKIPVYQTGKIQQIPVMP